MARKTVFILGADDFGMDRLKNPGETHDWVPKKLLDFHDIQKREGYDVPKLLEQAERILSDQPEIGGITGYWDFPVSSMIPILCDRFGMPGPSLESTLRCEHKYWARLEQKRVIPDFVPDFCAVDPSDDKLVTRWDFGYPFWLKPVKSWASQLGFLVESPQQFERALEQIRRKIHRFAEPFDYVLERVERPQEIQEVGGYSCIAERLIGGRQCTLEGYVSGGEVSCYGIFDSLRYEGMSSFSRYQYPSRLPPEPRTRMADAAKRLMKHVGFDQATFNIEFFWDEETDRIWLLEVNPRLSVSHADISFKVDGLSNLERLGTLATGDAPQFHKGQGEYAMAAKFMHRNFEDAFVRRVPTAEEVSEVERRVGGTTIQITAEQGQALSHLLNQDSYSYELALIHVGAQSDEELEAKFQAAVDLLSFELEPIPAGKG